jgi:hypothetical protein
MSGARLNALMLKRSADALRYAPLILIVIFLGAAVDLLFWYLAFHHGIKHQSAFIPVASAWALIVIGYLATWLQSITDQRSKSRESRAAAYRSFLSASDKRVEAEAHLVGAKADYDTAESEFDRASERYASDMSPENRRSKIFAETGLDRRTKLLQIASGKAGECQEFYIAASSDVETVVARSVRSAFEEFRNCPPQGTPARDGARSRFIEAAKADSGFMQEASKDTP